MKNVVEFAGRASIEQQACEWLIRLDGDEPLAKDDLEALRQWMARSPAHRQELTRLCKFWNQANILTELAIPLRPPDLAHDIPARSGPRFAWAAVAILVVVFAGWWGLQSLPQSRTHRYVTPVGEQKTVFLTDGSSIELNTNTVVEVSYTTRLRRFRLVQGEALFSAMHDPSRAFEVYANDSVVRAVGTAFSVHIDGSVIDVTVTKGVVDVAELHQDATQASQGEPRPQSGAPSSLGRLKAGQTTTLGRGHAHLQIKQLAEPELQRRLAWQEGYLSFSGEPLSEVVEQMNRYSPVTLTIGDPAIASVAVGGRFRIGDLDGVLDALHTNFGIESRQLENGSITLGKATE